MKVDKESVLKEALSNAKLWEARFGAADKSRQEYRENAKRLIAQNDRLQTAVDQVQSHAKDSIIGLFKVNSSSK